jgi:hypothetical protein
MSKFVKASKVIAFFLVLSLIGASAVSAKTERSSQGVEQTAIEPGDGSYIQCSLGIEECTRVAASTGRWIITYRRQGVGHYVTLCKLYVPDFIDNEKDARNWRWSDEYIADTCSLSDEPQTWQGEYLHLEKEYYYYIKCQLQEIA